jgi:citrate lyase subunit beta/citryl-CoA lyase
MGLQLGFIDLLSATGIDGDDPGARQYVRIHVRLAAAEAGIDAYDTAFPDFRRPDLFRADAEAARKAGFAGKSCIHPAQIEIANEVFSPSPDEVARARSILAKALEAAREHQGAFAVDGLMVDEPIIDKARRLVALAERFSIA